MGVIQHSALYECKVMHHRLIPKEHRFEYPMFMFYLDLDELESLSLVTSWLQVNRFGLYSFWEKDHLPLVGMLHLSLKERVGGYLLSQGVEKPLVRVMLFTNLRVLGYVFNPVSFYFCFGEAGEPLGAIAEVSNTFGEMKPFWVPWDPQQLEGYFARVRKHFYVSPFMNLEQFFGFRLKTPDEHLFLGVDTLQPREDRSHLKVLDSAQGMETLENQDPALSDVTWDVHLVSTLSGNKVALTAENLWRLTWKFPLITLKVIFLIHWHALLLYRKKIPFFSKESNPHLQTQVLNPHSSLKTFLGNHF
ncbi:MAG: DUF1365 domain-containing protein [Cyanobacteria bacterium]|nr:DUF1365 domain-containing protein [Cyanobacteriota bacterium]